MRGPSRVEQIQFGAHVGQLGGVADVHGLDFENGDLVDQFAVGNGSEEFGHGDILVVKSEF